MTSRPDVPDDSSSQLKLCRAMQALADSLELSRLCESIPRVAAESLAADVSVLRLRDAETGELALAGCVGAGRSAELLAAEAARAPEALATRRMLCWPGPAGPERAGGMILPLGPEADPQGTLGLFWDRDAPAAGSEAVRLLQPLAAQAGALLASARRLAAAEQLTAELSAVQEIGRAIASRLELTEVLEAVVAGALGLLGSQHAQIILWDPATERLTYGAALGPESSRVRIQRFALDRGVNGVVARTRQPLLVNDYQASPYALPEFPDVVATLTVPVLFGDRLLGILHSHATEPGRRFRADDRRRLEMLATQAAIAVENARLFREQERLAAEEISRLRKLSILGEIGAAMQGTMQLDPLLRVILTGVTLGEGLGFNRAALLLVDESRGILQGRMGVGPSSGEEAARIWGRLASGPHSLAEIVAERLEGGEGEASAFHRFAESLRIPLRPEAGVLARTVLEARAFRISTARQDPCVHPDWEGRLEVDEFASVPLLAKGRATGVIVADNRWTGKPIGDEDLEFLALFASQAGLAVESARVHTRLEEAHREVQKNHHQLLVQERLAALGEMSAHLVHEVRNPLVAIGGFARRLARGLQDRQVEGRYAEVIAREVTRLERILSDVREFAAQGRLHLEPTDLAALLDDCLILVEERIGRQGVRLEVTIGDRLPAVRLDAVRMKQAILNLLANALEAMPGGGTLAVSGFRRFLEEPAATAAGPDEAEPGGWIELSVADSGGGIALGSPERIFEPFFTT
ncbi:MAG: GAF domain-containing protein, partial [Candidatus Methylomirabilota bacterium]